MSLAFPDYTCISWYPGFQPESPPKLSLQCYHIRLLALGCISRLFYIHSAIRLQRHKDLWSDVIKAKHLHFFYSNVLYLLLLERPTVPDRNKQRKDYFDGFQEC